MCIYNGYDACAEAARRAGLSVRQMLTRAGKRETLISTARSRGSVPTTTTAAELLAVCDYVLAAVPCDQVPEGALVIDPPERGGERERAALKRKREKLARELAALDDQIKEDGGGANE